MARPAGRLAARPACLPADACRLPKRASEAGPPTARWRRARLRLRPFPAPDGQPPALVGRRARPDLSLRPLPASSPNFTKRARLEPATKASSFSKLTLTEPFGQDIFEWMYIRRKPLPVHTAG